MHVSGEGLLPCEIAVIGEAPGWQEDREGRPFVGKTGEELNRHLDAIGLDRDSLYLTNVFKEYRGKDYKWTKEDLEQATPELVNELTEVNPNLVVTLGRYATRWFLGDVDLDGTWGIPWFSPPNTLRPEGIVVFPVHHPAAGMHNPEMSPYVVMGFQRLGQYLTGELTPRRLYDDPYPDTRYEEVTTSERLFELTMNWSPATIVGVDTEGWVWNPWSIQCSDTPGTGFLIKKTRPDLLRQLQQILDDHQPRLVFNPSLQESAVGYSLGLALLRSRFEDTATMAYLLQLEARELKAGCLRNCNMQMSSYREIVGDTANDLARSYLTWIWDAEQADYEERQHEAFAAEITKGRRIKVLPNLPKTPLCKAVERVLSSKRPAELWQDQLLDLQVAAHGRLGPLPEATLDYVDRETAVRYGCRDADGTLRLYHEYSNRIKSLGLEEVYQLELATYPLLDRMQRVGIKPDLQQFQRLGSALTIDLDSRRAELSRVTGRSGFNANSGDQVAAYLFDELGLEEIKLTSSGRGSTNDLILEALQNEHPEYPQIELIRQYREFYKLKHTFVDRIEDYVNRWPYDGRVHTTLRTTRVVTGRLAAADPNLLAQPEHGDWALHFQRGWVADEGHVLAAWDESQIELRGLAHLSQDPVLLAVYRGELRNPDGSLIDLHANLAQRIFGGKASDYAEGTERLAAKAINFGLPMGMQAVGLSIQLRKNGVDADEDTAQRWIDETEALYTGVQTFKQAQIRTARDQGYIRCLSGRIRYIGGISSRNERVRAEAERFAFSTPIQESAQYIMKQAEVRVWREVLPYFWKQDVYCEPLLQVHDALKMEVQQGYELELHRAMVGAMTNVPKGFDVPLAVVGKVGPTFADMKKVKEK